MTTLKPGDKAPNFTAVNQSNQSLSMKDYQGKKLVLYFYPKDSTPGCTAEACNLRDNYHRFLNSGYAILGVSPDSPKSHVKFIEKYDLPFDLLSDQDHSVSLAYGVWGKKKFMGREYMGIFRTTFVINEDGTISDVITEVETKAHSAQILKPA